MKSLVSQRNHRPTVEFSLSPQGGTVEWSFSAYSCHMKNLLLLPLLDNSRSRDEADQIQTQTAA